MNAARVWGIGFALLGLYLMLSAMVPLNPVDVWRSIFASICLVMAANLLYGNFDH